MVYEDLHKQMEMRNVKVLLYRCVAYIIKKKKS